MLNLAVIKFERRRKTQTLHFEILDGLPTGGTFCDHFLHDTNPDGFARMINAILDGYSLAEAVMTGYETDLDKLWSRFVQANEN